MVGYVVREGILEKEKFHHSCDIVKVWTEEELDFFIREIELDLNCVLWITDEQRRLLDAILLKRFKELKGD